MTANTVKIRTVAQAIGYMVSSFPAVEYGPLYYRKLEKEKTVALSNYKGNFEALMTISQRAKVELPWWLNNLPDSFRPILPTPIETVIYSDASVTGWGAAIDEQSTGGNWDKQQALQHINIL